MHRNIKLSNVVMSDSSRHAVPKIIDFGLAKFIGKDQKADDNYGTQGYRAPEVILGQPYTYSCDIWSLGCLFH
jgi:calcium/calmodulin-dependent protein kinase I